MSGQPTKQKLWGGRFTGKTDPLWAIPLVHDNDDGGADSLDRMHAFNQSLRYDQRMHAADIRGSIAYAKALARVGILTSEEETEMIEGLEAVGKEWESGQVRCAAPIRVDPQTRRLVLVHPCTRRRRYSHRQ